MPRLFCSVNRNPQGSIFHLCRSCSRGPQSGAGSYHLSICGWRKSRLQLNRSAGVPTDAHDTLRFCVQTGARCIVQTTTLEGAEAAYTNMGSARFRMVVIVDTEEVEKERSQGLI